MTIATQQHDQVKMTSNDDTAIELLGDTTYFHDASASLKSALASKMIRSSVKSGHVLVHEGQPMEHVMILESGSLARTKLSVPKDQVPKLQRKLSNLDPKEGQEALQKNSIKIDEISGRGRVTGMLHGFKDESVAYATVTSQNDDTVVWLLPCESFREVITESPQHCLDILQAMARELRVGSKSLRGLVEKVRNGRESQGGSSSDEKICRVLCYDTTTWVSEGFQPAIDAFNEDEEVNGGYNIIMDFTTERLSESSATYAAGYDAVCLFVNDTANEKVLKTLSLMGVKMIALRCAGFDRVDAKAARAYGITVARVPAYSPFAVAEMAVALLMSLNRKIHRASNKVKMANFTLDAGLMGMDIHGKTVGVMGTGRIGQILCNIMLGFGVKLLCYDVFESDEVKAAGGKYVSQNEIFESCDIIFLMMPLLPATRHTINESVLPKLKKGVILINTSRGGLVDTKALLKGLQSGVIGGVGMDVYEHEEQYFFQDWSAKQIQDPDLVALMGQNNVVLTAHQSFFTKEAVDKIVSTTVSNIQDFQKGLTGEAHPNNCIPYPKLQG